MSDGMLDMLLWCDTLWTGSLPALPPLTWHNSAHWRPWNRGGETQAPPGTAQTIELHSFTQPQHPAPPSGTLVHNVWGTVFLAGNPYWTGGLFAIRFLFPPQSGTLIHNVLGILQLEAPKWKADIYHSFFSFTIHWFIILDGKRFCNQRGLRWSCQGQC